MKEPEESIRILAYVVWQTRCRRGDWDANNDKKNWAIAKQVLYPDELSDEERQYVS